jgi:D-3-phosphoglycerate dehydrogenase
MKPMIFIPEPIAEAGIDVLRPKFTCITPWADDKELGDEESRTLLHASDAVIVRLYEITREDFENSAQLKVVAKHGVGVDNIDVRAAAERKIPVVYTPTANLNAVAEHTVALMMALSRRIEPAMQAVKQGRFAERTSFQGVELAGRTLGVVGLGRIGTRVAEIAALGLSMNVIAFDPFTENLPDNCPFTLEKSIEDLFKVSDFLTFHVPLTPDTHHLINGDRLKLLTPECRIINTSRGKVIDEAALVDALKSGKVAGAALDVFEDEPLPKNHPLCAAPNILLTPHISSSTEESLNRMAVDSAQGVLDVLEGRSPQFPFRLETAS